MCSDNLSDELKKDLCIVNKRNLFFVNEDNKGKSHIVSFEVIKLARWIFKHFFGKIPCCKHIGMVLQNKIAIIEFPVRLKHKDFKYVIKLSSGNKEIKGKFFYLPVVSNTYADKFDGKLNTSCTLEFKNKKLVSVIISKKVVPVKPKLNSDVKVTFDIGNVILFALGDGSCYGKKYMKLLKWWDGQLVQLANNLKREHGSKVKLTNYPEYNRMVSRIQDFSKNEINRLLNKIFNKYTPSTIFVENLDFKRSKIGRKNNRILSRFGLGYITKKLEQFEEEYGIKVKYVDPPYSSQFCSECNYVDKKNRKKQEEFHCLACKQKINADVNASRTQPIFNERFGEKVFYGSKGRQQKLTLLVKAYYDDQKVWKNDKRIVQVMIDNKYFSNYHPLLRERLRELS
jgi:IS605 OrfB family transposase